MFVVQLILSIFIILLFFILSLRKRQRLSKVIRIFTIGLMLAIFTVLNLPEGSEKILRFFLTLQTGTLDADYEFIFASLPDNLLYKNYVKILCILSPLCFGGFILSFFEKFIDGLIFYLQRKMKNTYIFPDYSEINLRLALEIKKNEKKALIIFRNIDNSDEHYETIKENGFLVLNWTNSKFVFNTSKKCYFFQFSDHEIENINNTLSLFNLIHAKKISPKKANYKFFITIKEKSSEIIFDSLDKGLIEIKIINNEREITNNFFYENPIIQYLDKSSDVLILGDNNLFTEVIKTALVLSQFGNKRAVKINALTHKNNITKLTNQWQSINSNQYNLNLLESDFDTKSLLNSLQRINTNLSFIILCIDDYQTSFEIALFLRKFYIKMNLQNINIPYIFIYSQNDLGSIFCDSENQESPLYRIDSFGSFSSIYSYKNLFQNEIDAIALNIHATYMNGREKSEIARDFFSKEINRKSCRNNAIHLTYKLNYLGYKISTNRNIDTSVKTKLLNCLKDKTILSELGKMEHYRWVAFQESEGWTGADLEEVKIYSKYTHSHKYTNAKIHGCICSWDDLDLLGKQFGIDFKELDIRFILNLSDILGITENSAINISNISNFVEEI